MRTKFKIIKTWGQLLKLIECCKKSGYACVDFETNAEGIYNKGFKPTILSVTFQAGSGCSIPLDHPETKEVCGPGWNWKKALLKFGHEVIEDYDIVKLAWNGKFDFQIFNLYGIFYRGTLIDGMLAKYCLNEERPNGLKDMVRRYLPDVANYEADKGFDKLPWDKKPLKPLCKYGCQDTDYTFRLTIFFESRLIELGFYNLYRNLIMTSSRVLQSCEVNGLYMDRTFNEKLLAEYKPKIDKARETCLNLAHVKAFEKLYNMQKISKYVASIQAELDELDYNDPKDAKKIANREQKISNIKAGIFSNKKERDLVRPINLGSPVDLPQLLYSKEGFHMPIIKYTTDSKTGKPTDKPSTDEDTLTELRLKYKNPKSPKAIFLDSLLELRGLEKMYKTYIEGWHEKVQDDSCLHGKYNIIGTTSGRLSSSDPNLQQVPKTSVDPNIKNQLIAQPGKLYLVSDFSQAELRFMAHLAKDKTYLDAFNSGNDPHLAIAAQKYGVPYEEAYKIYHDENHPDHKVWKVRRKQAKQIAFGLIYGIGAKLLAVKLSDPKAGLIVTPEEAQKEMDIFFKQHPRLKKFKAKQEKYLQEHGYLMSLFGRRRRLPQIYGDNKDQAYAKRMALNFPCQSCASDVTLFGSVLIYYLMRQGKLPKMDEVATVHDACYYNTEPSLINIWTISAMWEIFRDPDTKPYFGFHVDDVTMDMDYTIGRTMAEELPFIPGYDYNKMLQPDFSVEEYMKEAKKYEGISIAEYRTKFKKEIKAYQDSWIKYQDFKHVKKCGILK